VSRRRYDVQLSSSAARAFRKLDADVQRRLARQIDSLTLNPRPPGATKLEGEADLYRVRASDYRIIYTIQGRLLTVLVLAIGHRKDSYRR
jgi:mRNA interferase RelE/StbE